MKQIVKCRIWIGILLVVVLIFAVALYNSEGRLIRGQAQEIGEEALFDDSSVLVVMDQTAGEVNKRFSKSFFGDVAISSVEDLTEVSPEYVGNIDGERFHQILKLELAYHDKSYVLQAVEKVNQIDGVKVASPNYRECDQDLCVRQVTLCSKRAASSCRSLDQGGQKCGKRSCGLF